MDTQMPNSTSSSSSSSSSSSKGETNRIVVTKFPAHTKVCDLKDFFGFKSVESISISCNRAVVQLKSRTDYTNALLRNKCKLLGRPVDIKPYKSLLVWRNNLIEETIQEREKELKLRQVIDRATSGRSRSRSRSPSRGHARLPERQVERTKKLTIDPPSPVFPPDEAANLKRIMSESRRQTSAAKVEPKINVDLSFNSTSDGEKNSTDSAKKIPIQILLLMRLILKEKSTDNMSTQQLKTLSSYFGQAAAVETAPSPQQQQQQQQPTRLPRAPAVYTKFRPKHSICSPPSSSSSTDIEEYQGPMKDDVFAANNSRSQPRASKTPVRS